MSNTTALVKTRRTEDSLTVTLPTHIVEAQNIREGETVEITIRKLRVDGFGAQRGIAPFTSDDELKPHK